MLKFLIIFVSIIMTLVSVKAGTGCVPNSNPSKIYTTLISGTNYNKNGSTSNLTLGCTWDFNTPSSPCKVGNPVGNGF